MALSATGVFEANGGHVSTSDSLNAGYFNPSGAGAGTDYSITAPIACTDLVIDGSDNTKVTSATISFTSAHQRNGIRVTAGTGFTTGLYEITAVSAGVATLDRAVGTTSSTGGTARVGGPLATPGGAFALASVTGQTVYLKYWATPYDCSSSVNVAGGRVQLTSNKPSYLIGYDTTRTLRNTNANRPLMRATANSMAVVTFTTGQLLRNIKVGRSGSQTGVTGYTDSGGASFASIERCRADDVVTGFSCNIGGRIFRECEAFTCSTVGFSNLASFSISYFDCVTGSCVIGFSGGGQYGEWIRCAALSGTTGFSLGSNNYTLNNCLAYGNSGNGFNVSGAFVMWLSNCLAVNNGGTGFILTSAAPVQSFLRGCAGYNNTTANLDANATAIAEGFVPLTADPFTAAGSLDFTLNNAAGGGALLKGTGYPTSFPGLVGTNRPDIGLFQSTISDGGGINYSLF